MKNGLKFALLDTQGRYKRKEDEENLTSRVWGSKNKV